MNRSKNIWILVTALITWFALIAQFYILVATTPGNGMTTLVAVGRFFIFFTVLTNLLVAITLTILLLVKQSTAGRFFSRPAVITAIALYIFIVGLVYNILLRSVWHPQGLQKLVDELLHVVVPLLFIMYWVLFAPKHNLHWTHTFQWLIFPAVYLVYAMIRGGLEGFYPYPFLDANTLPFGRVFTNCVSLVIVFIVLGLLFVFVGQKLNRSTD